jgi:hypothetical protein
MHFCVSQTPRVLHLPFLSFHNSHATSVNRECAPRLLSPVQRARHECYQESRVSPPTREASAPRVARMFHHTCLEKEHDAMIWSIVSCSWSHRKQWSSASRVTELDGISSTSLNSATPTEIFFIKKHISWFKILFF